MAFRVFSAAKRVSRPQPSIIRKGSQFLLCRFTSSSSLLKGLNRESISGLRSVKYSQLGREFKDRLAKLNDKSKEMKHKMRSLSDGMAEASAEFRNLRKPTGPVDKLEKMWLRGHVRYYLDCKIKFMDEFLKLNRQMSRTELGIAKECAGYEKLREDYMLSVARLFGFGFLNVVMVGLFYKAGRLLKPADVST
ncbi:uncharacterized protein LOC119999525 [Tripterygium wilfordii]|uniref:uncharacterized protein LOC119999525 n=1 Tax=Tripterygium wilfordii TaxID=458696 RepID=UPI0018F83D04|nr:uncharacterized protein LOC119999525 [Tripterygium wilfordii]